MQTYTQLKAQPISNGFHGFVCLAWSSFQKVALHPLNLMFSLGLPVFMYLIFGVGRDYSQMALPHGNVSAQVLVNMTLYGVVTAAASVAAGISLERANGVSRLFRLTPLSPVAFILSRTVASLLLISLAVAVTYSVGYATEAKMDGPVWFFTAVLLLAGALLATLVGLAFGFLFRSDAAYASSSAFTVVSAFLAGMFMPLEAAPQFIRAFSEYSPLYGVVKLASYPLYGMDFSFKWVVNFLVWVAVFGSLAVWAQRHDTGR